MTIAPSLRSRRGLIRFGAAALAAGAIALVAPGAAAPQQFAGNLVVDTTADGNDGECSNDCTLREAIALADTAAGRWVEIPPGVYRVTLGPLVITNDYVFGGSFLNNRSQGARTTIIEARGPGRVVRVPSGSTALLAGVTITGGTADTGGGALVESGGQLTLYDTIVTGNTATSRGGGIHSAGDVIVWTSTISGNRVTGGNGGGLAIDQNGDGFLFASTVSGNSAAGGAGVANSGSLISRQATLAANSGGGLLQEIGDGGAASLGNTLIARNQGGACGGAITAVFRGDWTANLDDDGTCAFTGAEGRTVPDAGLANLANNGGGTDTHALTSGSPAVNAGDVNQCGAVGTDQRHAAFVDTCDIGAFEFGGVPPEPELPPPVAGETVNVSESRGRVRVKLPGSDKFFELEQAQQVPVGSTFDTAKGRVNLQAAGSQRAWFYKGVFKLGQTKGAKPQSTLTLTGALACGSSANAAAKKKRRLWGDGKGRFRTKGKHSAATVVGTRWLVEDRCNGTLTKVTKGKVRVRDFRARKTVVVKAGRQYFARAR